MPIKTEADLSDIEIDNLETLIPTWAAAATRAAGIRALASGQTVLRTEGSQIVAVSGDGTKRVVGEAAPRRRVTVGEAIRVNRLSTFTSD